MSAKPPRRLLTKSTMPLHFDPNTYFGYLVHVPRTVQQVLQRDPTYRTRIQSRPSGFDFYFHSMLSFAAESFQEQCGLKTLRVVPAWLDNGRTGFVWVLPNTMRRHVSSKNKKALEAFQTLVGAVGPPVVFYSVECPVPHPRTAGPFCKEIEEMLLDNCRERFLAGDLPQDDALQNQHMKLTVKAN